MSLQGSRRQVTRAVNKSLRDDTHTSLPVCQCASVRCGASVPVSIYDIMTTQTLLCQCVSVLRASVLCAIAPVSVYDIMMTQTLLCQCGSVVSV